MKAPDTSSTSGEFILSTHAQERCLQRTGLSGGYVLSYLNRGAAVWLPRWRDAGDWHGLFFSAAADGFFVAVVATDAPVVKTVLTLPQWERNFHRLRPIWPALARVAAAQGGPAPAPAHASDDVTLEIILRARSSGESAPGSHTAFSLAALSCADLLQRQLVPQELEFRSAGHALNVALGLLKAPAFLDWVLELVLPHAALLDDSTELLLCARHGTLARYADITSALVLYLGGTPAARGGAVQCLGKDALAGLRILRASPVGACELPP